MPERPEIEMLARSGIPAVRKIADSLRVLCVERQLLPGMELPSVREAATKLGVHFNTVAEAYRVLAGEGWLDVKQGRGAMVTKHSVPQIKGRAWASEFRSQVRAATAQMRAKGVPAKKLAAELRALAKVVR